ncbi:MAG: hypothetical protein WD991_02025 [Candidatus Paceibacterota bacterium]
MHDENTDAPAGREEEKSSAISNPSSIQPLEDLECPECGIMMAISETGVECRKCGHSKPLY